MSRAGAKGLIALALAVATAAVFWSAADSDFVFDDREYMLADKHTAAGLTWEGLSWAFTSTGVSLYAPLTRISLMLDYQLFGRNPSGYHVVSVALHGLTSILIFLALAELTGAMWKSAAVGALCALHPLRVEPAAWISGRADLLAALFGILAVLAWTRHVRRRGAAWAWLAAGAFALGMLCKVILMTLPFALLLLDFWPLGRVRWARGGGPQERRGPGIGALLLEKAGLILVAVSLAGVSLSVLHLGLVPDSSERSPLGARVTTSLVSYAFYASKTLWPAGLTVFYPHRWGSYAWWELPGAVALLAALSTAAVVWARRRPYLATGWLWFLGTLLPVIGLYQARQYPVADRYAYVPQIGLFIMALWGLGEAGLGSQRRRAAAVATVAALIAACLPASRAQVRHWKDDASLFRHAIAVTKDNWLAHLNYGRALLEQRRYPEAAAELETSLRIKPSYAKTHNNLGIALANLGRVDEAVSHFRVALSLNPADDGAYFNLGRALLVQGSREDAIRAFRQAARLNPDAQLARSALRSLGGAP